MAVTSRGSPWVVRVSLCSFAMRSAIRLTEQPVSAVVITLNFGRATWESHKSMSTECDELPLLLPFPCPHFRHLRQMRQVFLS